jgi:hypothetical protein
MWLPLHEVAHGDQMALELAEIEKVYFAAVHVATSVYLVYKVLF